MADVWAAGNAYEPYVGRWSRVVAREFIEWLAVPPGARWVDVGCGTGALSTTILSATSPDQLRGIDASAAYVSFVRDRLADSRAEFAVADAQRLPFPSASADAA